MKRLSSSFWLMYVLVVLTSCTSLRPACPSIPAYPGAAAIGYIEEEEIIRTTTYQVAARSGDVITYFKQQLEQSGWSMRDEDATGFSMGYRTTDNQPPFLLSVMINEESPDIVEYRVSIAIHGPFAWRNWCSTLKP